MAKILKVCLMTIKRQAKKIKQGKRYEGKIHPISLPNMDENIMGQIMDNIRYEADCWSTDTDYILINGIWYSKKRLLYFYHKNCPISSNDIVVCRTCKNPKCIRPDHMLAKTYKKVRVNEIYI